MNWTLRIRQLHRWSSLALMATVVVYLIVMTWRTPPGWVTYGPLIPLATLVLTGVCLNVMAYLGTLRGSRRSERTVARG